jgi:hypothetical protein
VRLAARGTRDMDAGEERVADRAERAALQARARRVYVNATLTTAFLTAVVLLLPT